MFEEILLWIDSLFVFGQTIYLVWKGVTFVFSQICGYAFPAP